MAGLPWVGLLEMPTCKTVDRLRYGFDIRVSDQCFTPTCAGR